MQDIFGEELKKILQNSKIQVPKAYDKRIEETLSNISAKEKKPYLHFFYSKTAAMITICITVFASSLGAGAAINLYHEKMQSITQEDKKNYNETVQNSEKAGDSYSRSLTKQEEESSLCELPMKNVENFLKTKYVKSQRKKIYEKMNWHFVPKTVHFIFHKRL